MRGQFEDKVVQSAQPRHERHQNASIGSVHDDKSSADSQSKATGLGLSMYQSVLESKPTVLQYKMGPFMKPTIKKKNRDLINVTHGPTFKHQNSAISPNVVTEYLR